MLVHARMRPVLQEQGGGQQQWSGQQFLACCLPAWVHTVCVCTMQQKAPGWPTQLALHTAQGVTRGLRAGAAGARATHTLLAVALAQPPLSPIMEPPSVAIALAAVTTWSARR